MPHNYIKTSDKFFVFFMSPYFVYVTAFDGRVKFVQSFNFATFPFLIYIFPYIFKHVTPRSTEVLV